MVDLAARGTPVTLFLVQNGALVARQGADAGQLTALAAAPALTFGPATSEFPPRLDRDLSQALEAGVKLALVRDDAAVRGIPVPVTILMPEVEQISREQLAEFLNGFDLVWHW